MKISNISSITVQSLCFNHLAFRNHPPFKDAHQGFEGEHLTMALRETRESWKDFLMNSGIPDAESSTYADTMVENRLTDPCDLTKELLKELNITIAGDIIGILKSAKKEVSEHKAPSPSRHNIPQAYVDQTS